MERQSVCKQSYTLILSLIGILQFSPVYSYTEWFPLGAKWYYHSENTTAGNIQSHLFTVEKDTIVDGKNCRLVCGKNYADIVYEENGCVYYYFNKKFRKIYDFNVNEGDIVEFEFKTINTDIPEWWLNTFDTTIVLPMEIESITTRIVDGVELREISAFYINDTPEAYWTYRHKYLEKIGVEHTELMDGIFPVHPGGATVASVLFMRCYHDPNIEYVSDRWKNENKPCDYEMNSIENIDTNNGVILYPNPFDNKIFVSASNGGTIEIIDISGKVVYSWELSNGINEISTNRLFKGFYLVKIQQAGNIQTFKIIKE